MEGDQTTPNQEEPPTGQPPADTSPEGGVKSEDPPPSKTQEPAPAPSKTQEPAPAPSKTQEPAPAPVLEFHCVKEGFVQRQGLLLKKWNRQWMTLDEGGAALRWYKTETRAGNDGTLYMSKCAEVCEPKEGVTTTWPEGVEDCCFVVCSPNRAHYIIAESKEDKDDWMAKLREAKDKYNTEGVKIVSVDLFSVEAIKVAFSAEMARAQSGTDQTLAEHGTSTEQVGKSLDSAVQDAEKELKKDQTVQQVAKETEQATQQLDIEVKVETKETGETGEIGKTGEGGDTEEIGETGGTGEGGATGEDSEIKESGDAVEVQMTEEKEETTAEEGAGKE